MNGEWTILLWILVSVVFLVKIAPVRRIVSTVRQQPLLVQIVAVLTLCLAIINGSTKTNSQNAASQIASPSSRNSSLIIENSSLSSAMPAWWNDDDTDSDADGIPDLWEKWTHGNRLVDDDDLDRDDDGLTDLEEFQNQTDPRTADTDGDGFSDAFEVANGMNPVSAEDFTPTEPDADHNGRIDLWENAPYYYGFTDADHDGFDDYYENEVLEPASDENFDVVVTVYTTRSAVLTWNGGLDGIVLLPTTETCVRLRLPFGVDSTVNLLPSPTGTDPPSGELWKSFMRLAFSLRSGQRIYGNALVSPDGMIAHKVVNQDTTIELFAPLSPMSGFQTLSLTGGGSSGPSTDIQARKFEVYWIAKYHGMGDTVGAFTVTNQLGMGDAVYDWSSAFGDMDPASGMESWLTDTRLPGPDEMMTVVTAAALDSESRVAVTNIVEKCIHRTFSADLSTNNFSPQLGETLGVGVTLPECEHTLTPGWLEIEVVREVIGATQHVASVDMDLQTPGLDRYLDTSTLGGQSLSFEWDGTAQVGLALADHPDIFTHTNAVPFHRAMPAITSGEPVPPPFYTLVVKMYNTEKTTILHHTSWTIYVPQVVQVKWQGDAATLFRTSITHDFQGQSTLVYSANFAGDSNALMQVTLQRIRAYYPANVNIRFVPFFSSDIETTKFLFITPDIRRKLVTDATGKKREVYEFGTTSPATLQRSAAGMSSGFLGSINEKALNLYNDYAKGDRDTAPFPVPLLSDQILDAACRVSAHEVGHALGLVDTHYLGGVGEKHNSGPNDQTKMMNVSTDLEYMFNPHLPIGWQTLNEEYLLFVLPVPK